MNLELVKYEEGIEEQEQKEKTQLLQMANRTNKDKMQDEKDENLNESHIQREQIDETNDRKGKKVVKENTNKLIKALKEEELSFKEIQQEIFEKNLRIFYITNIFSADYTKFISSLITNYDQSELVNSESLTLEETQSTNDPKYSEENMICEEVQDQGVKYGCKHKKGFENLFEFICTVYFTTIVRMNDKKLQNYYFEWLCDRMDKVTV